MLTPGRKQGGAWLQLVIGMWAFIPGMAAQQLMTNSQGEKIVVFPDGSWRPAEPGDSVWIATSPIDPLSSATEDPSAGRSPWSTLQMRIRQEQEAAQSAFRSATNAQFKAGEALRNARANAALLDPVAIRDFEEAYQASVDRLAQARKRQKSIEQVTGEAARIRESDLEVDDPHFRRLSTLLSAYLQKYVPGAVAPDFGPGNRKPAAGMVSQKATGSEPEAVSRTGRTPPCQRTPGSTDPSTGLPVRGTLPSDLLFYTDPELRAFFKNKDLITARVWVSTVGATVFLHLEFEIASANSQTSFGGIAQGALMRLKTLDGELLTLYNTRNDRGRIDTYSGHTLYTAQYTLSREEIKKLRSAELDKIRVLWVTGFEDYEIIYPDIVRQQLDCLLEE